MKIDKRLYLGLMALLTGLLAPFITNMSPHIIRVLTIMLIFIMFSTAWNLLTYSGQASLGHAAFFGIGGYASALIAKNLGLPPFFTVLIGGLLAGIAGILVGLTCIRLREWFLAMVTFGFAIIAQPLAGIQFERWTGGWDGMSAPRFVAASNPLYYVYEYYIILAFTLGVIILAYVIMKSKIGIAFSAIRENELEAKTIGIDVTKYKLLAFAISTSIAGVAGAFQTHNFSYITPGIFGIDISFWPVIYCISGGLNTLEGPIIGTIVITFIWEGLKTLGWTFERFILIGIILILVVIFLPKGFVSVLKKPKEIKTYIPR